MAQIHREGQFICGGVILTQIFILTAAHCALDAWTTTELQNLKVVTGQLESGRPQTAGAQSRQVVRVIKPNPRPSNSASYGGVWTNDIAILQLAEPLQTNDRVQSVNLETVSPKCQGPSQIGRAHV